MAPTEKLENAINRVRERVYLDQNSKDIDYFIFHEDRFRRMAKTILSEVKEGSEILNIGSHYLHGSMILSELGYKVFATDVDAFWDVEFIAQRKKDFNIDGNKENDIEQFNSLNIIRDRFDVILFTEILEHITFNPVMMWQKLYQSSKNGALIYLTTPNSLFLPNFVRSIYRLFSFQGTGISTTDVLEYVTYGHHWKEYSRKEIQSYFYAISNDFRVTTKLFHYQKKVQDKGFGNMIWSMLSWIGNMTYWFSSDIEAFIYVNKSDQPFKIETPNFV